MLDIIQHNPFRLIGVFSTATRKEIVANLARIKANIRVDRQISFPTDLDGILLSPNRTAETIADAETKNGNVKGDFVSGGHIQKDGHVELYNQHGEYTLYPVQNGNLQLQGASKGEAF